jgi:hypothetical protein
MPYDGAAAAQSGWGYRGSAAIMTNRPQAELRFEEPTAEAGSGVASWVHDVVPRLQDVMMLEDNWNSYGARKVAISHLQALVVLLVRLMRPNTPTPLIVPTADGSLQIEWHEKGIDLEVRIQRQSRYYVCFEDLRNPGNEWEGVITSNLTQLKKAIDELTGRPD